MLGLAAGGGLYFVALFSTLAVIVVLRFGPRSPGSDEEGVEGTEGGRVELGEVESMVAAAMPPKLGISHKAKVSYPSESDFDSRRSGGKNSTTVARSGSGVSYHGD